MTSREVSWVSKAYPDFFEVVEEACQEVRHESGLDIVLVRQRDEQVCDHLQEGFSDCGVRIVYQRGEVVQVVARLVEVFDRHVVRVSEADQHVEHVDRVLPGAAEQQVVQRLNRRDFYRGLFAGEGQQNRSGDPDCEVEHQLFEVDHEV